MNRKIVVLIGLLLCSFLVKGQNKIGISLLQDAKLLVLGDEKHNINAGSYDILLRVHLQGYQQKYGYMQIYPELEVAQLDGDYKRFTFNVGYVLNKLVVNNLEVGASVNFGIIDRYKLNYWTYGGSLEVNYKLSDNLKIATSSQLIKRGDLLYAYGTKDLKPAFYVGLMYNF